MNRIITGSLAVTSVLAATSCGIFGGSETRTQQVSDLVTWVERVHVESELSREKVLAAAGALRAITQQDFQGDPVAAFQQFQAAITDSERQAASLRAAIEPMKASAGPVFEQWSNDLVAFANSGMRQRSMARLDETRQRFHEVVGAVDPAQSSFESFNLALRDVALFLGNDFNSTAVRAVQEDAVGLAKMASDLDLRLEQSLTASQSYIQASALPAAAPPAPGGAAPMQPAVPQPEPPAAVRSTTTTPAPVGPPPPPRPRAKTPQR